MNDQEIREAYPGCWSIVLAAESGKLKLPTWTILATLDRSPEFVAGVIMGFCMAGCAHRTDILSQVHHPDFTRYVAAKLGAL